MCSDHRKATVMEHLWKSQAKAGAVKPCLCDLTSEVIIPVLCLSLLRCSNNSEHKVLSPKLQAVLSEWHCSTVRREGSEHRDGADKNAEWVQESCGYLASLGLSLSSVN